MYAMVAEGQGERLERLRTEAGLTVYRLAKLSGISRTLIYLIETGRRPLKYDTAKKFAPYINATVEYLLEGIEKESPEQTARKAIAEVEKLLKNVKNAEVEHPSALVTLPLRGGLPCGTPFPEEQQEGENILVPREMLGTAANNADVYALKVKGNSLEGDGIHDGQYVVVEPGARLTNGEIYVVRLGNSVVGRHVEKVGSKLRLRASNNGYEDLEPSEVELLGRIIAWGGWRK